jgi:molybdenum cofactor synthesis domain-containing protein
MEARQYRCAVVTISDRCARGQATDASGPAIVGLLESWGWSVQERALLPDEPDEIAAKLAALADQGCDLVLTTGGTGLGPRDRTPEATLRIAERQVPGLAELARSRSGAAFPHAYLSRGMAVLRGNCLILNLPGSPNGARDHLGALAEILPHALAVLREDPQGPRPSHPGSKSSPPELRS